MAIYYLGSTICACTNNSVVLLLGTERRPSVPRHGLGGCQNGAKAIYIYTIVVHVMI